MIPDPEFERAAEKNTGFPPKSAAGMTIGKIAANVKTRNLDASHFPLFALRQQLPKGIRASAPRTLGQQLMETTP